MEAYNEASFSSAFLAWTKLRGSFKHAEDELANRLDPYSVSPREFEVLAAIASRGGEVVSQNQLENVTGLAQSSQSRLISQMERKGLVRRHRDDTDQRVLVVNTTGKGEAVLEHTADVFREWVQDAITKTDIEDSERVASLGIASDGEVLLGFGESILSLRDRAMDVSDAIHVRDALEPLILGEASLYRTESDLKDYRQLLRRMESAIPNQEAFYRLDWELHLRLAATCRNSVLRTTYTGLLEAIRERVAGVRDSKGGESYLRRRLAIHEEIVDSVESGNAQRVGQAATAHRFLTGQLTKLPTD